LIGIYAKNLFVKDSITAFLVEHNDVLQSDKTNPQMTKDFFRRVFKSSVQLTTRFDIILAHEINMLINNPAFQSITLTDGGESN
jgi:hypothetical protein